MIDKNAILVAVRARLTADATLMTLVQGVYQMYVPSTANWVLPNIELGEQAEDEDLPGLGYGQKGADFRLRLMCHAKGPAPGVGSFASVWAALRQADTVLTASAFTTAGTWYLRRIGAIPQASQPDDAGFLRMQAGNLYRLRVVE